jgi:hypothetical protein
MKPTNKNLISFEIKCVVCDTKHTIMVTDVDVADWQDGMFAQDAFPYLTADERELILSQTCGSCFDKIYPQMEE